MASTAGLKNIGWWVVTMRQGLPRIPKDRIAVLIGSKGTTAKSLRNASGAKEFHIDSETGDVEVVWGEPGSYDPIKALKFPDVIKAIGRGMAPKAAIRLLEDENFFEMVDLKDFVGKRSHQQRRIRARIIGSQGKVRRLIENLTDVEITIYKSTVVLVGDAEGIGLARQAVEMLAGGSEHGTVLSFLERRRKRMKFDNRSLDSIVAKESKEETSTGFDGLVPGLSDVSERRGRKLRASQVDPEDDEAVEDMMEMADDEHIVWEEE
jgi:ribosomal RNA assembly protein